DRQPEAGAAVEPARRRVGLLERLEDEPLLLGLDPDAGVADGEGDDRGRAYERLALERLRVALERDLEAHAARLGELEGVREQVLEDLLEALRVRRDRGRHLRRDLHLELHLLLPRDR